MPRRNLASNAGESPLESIRTIRVVIIDDRLVISSALQLLVEQRSSFEVVGTSNKDPIALHAALQRRPDIVLVNTGHDAARDIAAISRLRESGPTRVLLLMDGVDQVTLDRAIRLGARGAVAKESSPDMLMTALECVHAGEYWMDRALAARFISEACLPVAEAKARQAKRQGIEGLTTRERDIVALIAEGLRNKQIGIRLSISETTVRHHLTSIFTKLDVSDRLALVIYALKHGLVGDSHRPRFLKADLLVPSTTASASTRTSSRVPPR